MNTRSRSVLILGANGNLGSEATKTFSDAGWRVFAVARKPISVETGKSLHTLVSTIENSREIVEFATGVSAVLYCANPPYTQWPRRALSMAKDAVAIARALNATFLFPGNVYNFGSTMPNLLFEDTPQNADTRKGRLRCEIESMIRAECERGLRAVTLRAGDFFGARSGSWFDRVIASKLSSNRAIYPGPLDIAHAWAYLPDLAQAFVRLAERNVSSVRSRDVVYEAFGFPGHNLTGDALLTALENAHRNASGDVSLAHKRGSVPWSLYRVLSPIVPILREVVEIEYLWRVPHSIDGATLGQAIGDVPHTALNLAMSRTVANLLC
ncbi:MAG: NAD-dependent epimerase/dehydratase family protein [Casimicrobium sp.]